MVFFKFENSGIPKSKLYSTAKKLVPEIRRIAKVSDYSNSYASVHLPYDKVSLKAVQACISLKKKLKPSLLVIVGIGGSNLGTKAVHEAVNSSQKVLFADTVDPDLIAFISEQMKNELRQGRQVLLNIVSKSGTTTETIANFEVLFNVLKRHRRDAENYVVVTTGRGSKLWNFAIKRNMSVLEVPENVGGRYSVFSPVGLFPLGFMGVDLKKLIEGAAAMRQKCSVEDVRKNPAAIGAALLYLHSKEKRNIYNHFMFAKGFESLGKWYRQLLAESIGKEENVKGKKVNVGITPIVSIGSTDLHSMAQLYLGGPDDKFTNFLTVNFSKKIQTPYYADFNKLVSNLQKRELADLMHAIYGGVKSAYKKDKRPFTETKLEFKDEKSVAGFMQLKMIETMLLGVLFKVNPFDQPAVEKYKKVTRALLKR